MDWFRRPLGGRRVGPGILSYSSALFFSITSYYSCDCDLCCLLLFLFPPRCHYIVAYDHTYRSITPTLPRALTILTKIIDRTESFKARLNYDRGTRHIDQCTRPSLEISIALPIYSVHTHGRDRIGQIYHGDLSNHSDEHNEVERFFFWHRSLFTFFWCFVLCTHSFSI